MTKYNSLTKYLNGVPNEKTLTWAQLDEIVAGMPTSAIKYREWWSGDRPNVRAWQSAGFIITNLKQGSHVTFVRRVPMSTLAPSTTRRETTAERNGVNSLLGKVNQSMTRSDQLQNEGLAYVGPIAIERDTSGLPLKYLPQDRYERKDQLSLNKHGEGPFGRFVIPKLSDGSGVYAITVDNSVVYIGECQNFRERFGPRGYGVIHPRNCFVGGQSTNCKVNARVLEATLKNSIPELWFAPEVAGNRKRVEAELLAKFQPQWNGRG